MARERRGETFRDALDRLDVDVFLGSGVPEEIFPGSKRFYTTLRLEDDTLEPPCSDVLDQICWQNTHRIFGLSEGDDWMKGCTRP